MIDPYLVRMIIFTAKQHIDREGHRLLTREEDPAFLLAFGHACFEIWGLVDRVDPWDNPNIDSALDEVDKDS